MRVGPHRPHSSCFSITTHHSSRLTCHFQGLSLPASSFDLLYHESSTECLLTGSHLAGHEGIPQIGPLSQTRVYRPLLADLSLISECSPCPRSCHTDMIRRFGSQLSVADTIPPAYREGDAPPMSDDKLPSSCPKCGHSAAFSNDPDHSAQTLALVVVPPTETPTETPTELFTAVDLIQRRIGELIPELELLQSRATDDERDFFKAKGEHAQRSAFAERTISATKLEEASISLEAHLKWAAEVGAEFSDMQHSMSAMRTKIKTQNTVRDLWTRMEQKRAKKKDV